MNPLNIPALSIWVLLIGLSQAGAATAPSKVVLPKAESAPLVIKSVFVDDLKFGKDPFFPKANTRETAAVAGTPAAQALTSLPKNLVLKGLSGPPSRRLAIINNSPFAAGESAKIKVDGELLTIQCLEVREKSVLLKCNDSPPKELPLRKGM